MRDEWKSEGQECSRERKVKGRSPEVGENRCGRHQEQKRRMNGAYYRDDLQDRVDL